MIIMIAFALLSLAAIVGSIVALPKDGYHRMPTTWDTNGLARSQR